MYNLVLENTRRVKPEPLHAKVEQHEQVSETLTGTRVLEDVQTVHALGLRRKIKDAHEVLLAMGNVWLLLPWSNLENMGVLITNYSTLDMSNLY